MSSSNKSLLQLKDYPLVEVDISEIKKDPTNPNVMSLEQSRGLEKSMLNFGRLKYIVVDQNNVLIDGEHRLEVEEAIGTKRIQVIRVQVKDEIERKMMRETLNKLHGEYNKQKESSELLAIFENNRLDEVAELLAQPKQDLQNLISRYNPHIKFEREEDIDAKLPSLYDTESFVKRGEIWKLGRHYLMCGDSTTKEDITILLNNKIADLILTDPPYNMMGSSHGFTKLDDDNMVKPFFRSIAETIRIFLKKDGHGYVFCNWRSYPTIAQTFKDANLTPKNLIVWHKPNMLIGNMYASSHELIYFIANENKTHLKPSEPERNVRLVEGETNVWIYNMTTVEERKKATNYESHNSHMAVKPLELLKRAIKNSSEENQIILDPFLGSGSTLIACEQTNRICYGMEIDEHYCSVIIKRWELYTNQKAEKVRG